MSFVIEKNVPMPEEKMGMSAIMRKLSIGDSFLIPKGSKTNVYVIAKQVGIKVCIRLEGTDSVRVWRKA